MANQVRVGVGVSGARKASGEIKSVRDAFERLQKQGAKGFGVGVGATVTAKGLDAVGMAASFAVDQIFESIDAASALNETLSKSGVIFGDSAGELEAWAETAAEAFGQSKRQALDTASGFAGLFNTVGIELDKAAGMSQKLTVLGSDLASFFNTDVQTAIDAIRSGLSGESEPLRKFNVFLSETAVSAKLAQMGIKKVGGQFTEAQKATARYQLILEQTGAAQGDFARTSDGLANSQRTLQTQMEDLQAKIGQELLPVMVELVRFASDTLVPAISELVDIVKAAKPAFDLLGISVGTILDPMGTATKAAEDAWLEFDKWKNSIGAVEDRSYDAIEALRATRGATGDVEVAVEGATDAFEGAAKETKSYTDRLEDAEDAARGVEDAISDLADELFGMPILLGDVAEAQRDLNEKIKEGPDSKSAADVAIHTGEIAELRARLFELHAEYAKSQGPEAFAAWLDAQEAALGGTNTEIQRMIDKLRILGQVSGDLPPIITTGSGGGIKDPGLDAFASGGISRGGLARVGEDGEEIVDLPPGSRVRNATESRNAGRGGDTIINLTIQGSLIASTKEEVVRELQRAASFVRG